MAGVVLPELVRLRISFIFRSGTRPCMGDHRLASRGFSWFVRRKMTTSTGASASASYDPVQVYGDRVRQGMLKKDSRQMEVLQQYQGLAKELAGYTPKNAPSGNFFATLFGGSRRHEVDAPKGMYVYGTVGTGKTMLMDLFYECVEFPKKRRVHFNAFMLDVHHRIHVFKQGLPDTTDVRKGLSYDPIAAVSKELTAQDSLLCFDEFQVTDIADAMILKRLFTLLFESGVVVVATSNRSPDDLYKNGLQRAAFVPFIDVLKNYCTIVSLNTGIDYRTISMGGDRKSNYFLTSQPESQRAVDRIFKMLTETQNDTVRSKRLRIKGREVEFAKTCGKVLDATFDELCVRIFDTFIIRDVPVMSLKRKDQLRRFISLIDTMYDQKSRLVVLADAPPDKLFSATEDESGLGDTMLMDDLKIKHGDDNSKANVFTGQEELFAMGRTVSRLMEMQKEQYWTKATAA